MADRDFPNSGILFSNDRATHPKAPQQKGSGEVTCPHCNQVIELDLAGWKREGRKGPFLSLKLTPKSEANGRDWQRRD